MVPNELQDALQFVFEQARQWAPIVGCAALAVPGIAVALQVLGVWTWEK